MYVISLKQPWATLVVLGAKKIETRSWGTKYRGMLAIHASKGFSGRDKLLMFSQPFFDALKAEPYFDFEGDLPAGYILGTVTLVECIKIEASLPLILSYNERAFGDHSAGRFMWILENPQRWGKRIPTKGSLGIWEWNEAGH
jgi:activating signal cointegrator 1